MEISFEKIKPNDWNPNQMSEDQFGELVNEVKHLGKPPKPIVLRKKGDGYEIIDGEHNFKALQENGHSVLCEGWFVIEDYNNVEAMRQTYKRNLHGNHNPVKLGLLFEKAMAEGDLSQRQLAEQWGISEGTVRNYLEYSKAFHVRNDYAPIERLSVKQVRYYNRLPQIIADVWVNKTQADIKALYLNYLKGEDNVEALEYEYGRNDSSIHDLYWELDKAGMFEFLPSIYNSQTFIAAINKLWKWSGWESKWTRRIIPREEIRPYSRLLFKEKWAVRESHMMDSALSMIVKVDGNGYNFLLTPDEFADVVEKSLSAIELHDRLKLALARKQGVAPSDIEYENLRKKLLELEIEAKAPDYIKDAAIPPEAKMVIWQWGQWEQKEAREGIIFGSREWLETQPQERILRAKMLVIDEVAKQKSYLSEDKIKRMLSDTVVKLCKDDQILNLSDEEFANTVITNMGLYDQEKDKDKINILQRKLLELTRDELIALAGYAEDMRAAKERDKFLKAAAVMIQRLLRPKGSKVS